VSAPTSSRPTGDLDRRPLPSFRLLLRYVVALALAYGVLDFLLIPSNRIVLFPLHQDDYSHLSSSLSFLRPWPSRPVSTVAIALLSDAGPRCYYIALNVLILLYPALVLLFLSHLFRRPLSLFSASLVGALVYAFPNSLDFAKYTGLLTNYSSAVFGVLAMLLFIESNRAGRPRLASALGVGFFALSIFSKEDYGLPALLLVVYLLTFERAEKRSHAVLLGALLLLCTGLAVYNVGSGNPYTAGASEPYKIGLSPGSVVTTLCRYLFMSRYLAAATLAFGAALLAALRWLPLWRVRAILVGAVVAALVAPYSVLPHHVMPYYPFGWLVWQVGLLAIVASELVRTLGGRAERIALLMASALALAAVATTRTERWRIVSWYQQMAERNRHMVQTLVENRDVIRRERRVGIVGVEGLSPWSLSNGNYLRRRLDLWNEWVVFASPNSFLRTVPGSGIEVTSISQAPEFGKMLFIRFDEKGNGTLSRGLGPREQTTNP